MKTIKFNFTDAEFINVINLMYKLDKPNYSKFIPVSSINDRLDMGRFDSLGIVLFFIWLSDLFGIDENKIEEFMNTGNFTILAIKDFVNAEHTKTYSYTGAEYRTMLDELSRGPK